MMQDYFHKELDYISQCFIQLKELSPQLEQVASLWVEAYRRGNKIIFCGNGGSAADSQHLAAELVGRYQMERAPMDAIALTTDTSILTAVANDYGYEQIFTRQVAAVGKAGDVLVGLSTSGNSKNVLLAMQQAEQMNIHTVALTGQSGGEMRNNADLLINVPATSANHIQEMHIAIGHMLCGITEKMIHGNQQDPPSAP